MKFVVAFLVAALVATAAAQPAKTGPGDWLDKATTQVNTALSSTLDKLASIAAQSGKKGAEALEKVKELLKQLEVKKGEQQPRILNSHMKG
ncbi:unnamed protein product, partial [Nesidiocoris tenuis]